MTTTLRPAPVSYKQLDWNPLTKSATADMSSLRGLGQVYDDSCDEGFTVVGKTGREVTFVVTDVRWDSEGDLMWWDFKPAHPADQGLVSSIRVYND